MTFARAYPLFLGPLGDLTLCFFMTGILTLKSKALAAALNIEKGEPKSESWMKEGSGRLKVLIPRK